MRVAIDLDGVLGDVVSNILPKLNEEYGTNYTKIDINEWNFPIGGISIGTHLKRYFADPAFLLTVPVIEGAKEALKKIMKDHEVVIVTGRPNYTKRYTYMWLVDNFLFNGVIFTPNKTVQSTGCDVLVDDSHGYLNKFRFSGGKTIQFVQPWNLSHLTDNCAHFWSEVPDMINDI